MARFEFFLLIMVNYSEDFALTTSKRDRFFVETFKRTASYVYLVFEKKKRGDHEEQCSRAIARAGSSDEQTHDTSSSNDAEVKYVDFLDVESFAKNGTHFFVMLTGHDCYHCNLVLEDMEAIKKALKEVVPPLLFLVMDIESPVNKPIRDQLKVTAIPTIYLFLANVHPILFDLKPDPQNFVQFYKTVTNVVVEKVETKEELEIFKKSAYAAVLFRADEDINSTHILYSVARQHYDIRFGYAIPFDDTYKMFEDWITVFREGKRKIVSMPRRTTQEIEKFIQVQTHKPYFHFPAIAYALPAMYEENYLFYIDNTAGLDEAKSWLEKLGDEGRGDLVVLLCDHSDPAADRALKYFGVEQGDPPRVRIIQRAENLHFKMEDNMTDPVNEESVRELLRRFKNGTLKPATKSMLPPPDWDQKPLKILVGSTYAKVVNDTSKHVFVLLYAPGEQLSDLAAKSFEELSEKYKNFDDLLIAKIDVDTNDIPHGFDRIGNIPATRFYPKGDKKELLHSSSASVEGFIDLLKNYTGYDPNTGKGKLEEDEVTHAEL